MSIDDIRAAAERLDGIAVRTDVVPFDERLSLKLENQQPIGAFKLRGAYNAVARLDDAQRKCGVITHSSGNHGQALAYAARALGVPAVVVMPEGSVPLKVERVGGFGGEVVMVPVAERQATAERLASERGMTLIPPYDHPDVIAGAGTVGLEILESVPDVEAVLVPVGGGGLISGVATAVKALRPEVRVVGVEPELAGDAHESFQAGRLVQWDVARRARTVADGARVNLSELTFAHIAARVDDIVTVSDDEIRDAVRTLSRRTGVTAEPTGALTTAGYLRYRDDLPAGRVVAVVTGGNVDPALLDELLAG